MAFQVSAGVEVKEIDLTNVVPAVSTSIGGYAGQFRWGPIEEIKLIGSESELANEFGKPDDYHARSFYTASSFLKYGSALKVVRATDSELKNSSNGDPGGRLTAIAVNTADTDKLRDIDAATDIGANQYTVLSNTGSGAVIEPVYKVKSIGIVATAKGSGYTADSTTEEVRVDLGNNQELIVDLSNGSDGVPSSVAFVGNHNSITGGRSADTPTFTLPTKFSSVDTISAAGNGSVGATGSGLKLDIKYQLESFNIINAGSGYTAPLQAGGSELNFADTRHASTNSPGCRILLNGTEVFPRDRGALNSTNEDEGQLEVSISTVSNAATLIKNDDDFESIKASLTGGVYSRYAGKLGNKTKVYVVDKNNFSSLTIGTSTTTVGSQFDSIPVDTTVDGDTESEIHVLVTSTAGSLTDQGENETIVERWPFLQTQPTAKKSDGTNNYFVDVINKGSDWIYVKDSAQSAGVYTLTGGVDATGREDSNLVTALDQFADSETVDVNLLFTEADTDGKTTLANKVLSLATARKDAVGFISPAIDDTVNTTTPMDNVIDFLQSTDATITPRNSYGVLGSTAVYVYDKFNDKFLYIGTQGHLAGLCANTDQVAETWFSPGGFNRGQLRGVTKLAYNPKKADRDELYKAGINPLVTFPGQGTVLFGDKTLQAKPSAFDRINVRRLFITLEKAIATASKFQLFELNDEFTRAAFRNLVEPFLRDVQGRRGITDFLVVCDETNNTGQVIDTNRFVADIYIKPARSINFITLNFIATRTGVDFSEIVGNV